MWMNTTIFFTVKIRSILFCLCIVEDQTEVPTKLFIEPHPLSECVHLTSGHHRHTPDVFDER